MVALRVEFLVKECSRFERLLAKNPGTKAVDGEDALHQISVVQPDLVITDLQMPYLNGLEVCRRLGAEDSTADIPVIILTARGYALGGDAAGLTNVRCVVAKPFSPRTILERVHAVLGTSEVIQERAA